MVSFDSRIDEFLLTLFTDTIRLSPSVWLKFEMVFLEHRAVGRLRAVWSRGRLFHSFAQLSAQIVITALNRGLPVSNYDVWKIIHISGETNNVNNAWCSDFAVVYSHPPCQDAQLMSKRCRGQPIRLPINRLSVVFNAPITVELR